MTANRLLEVTFLAGGKRYIQTGKMLHLMTGCSRFLGQQSGKLGYRRLMLDRRTKRREDCALAPAVQGTAVTLTFDIDRDLEHILDAR